jgi:hypothetical protein
LQIIKLQFLYFILLQTKISFYSCLKFIEGRAILGIVGGVSLQEGDETFFSSVTVEIDGGVLSSLGIELYGGETLDVKTVNFVGGGVHLGNNDSLGVLELAGEGRVDGGEGLAVTAPGSVVFNQNIIIRVEDDIFEVLADEDSNVIFVGVGGDISRLEERLKLVVNEIVVESLEVVDGEFVFENVLKVVLAGGNESESGSLILGNTDVVSQSGAESVIESSDGEGDFTLQVFRSLSEDFFSLVTSFISSSDEEEGVETFTENLLGSLLFEGKDGGESVVIDEVLDFSGISRSRVDVLAFIELLEDDDGIAFSFVLLSDGFFSRVGESKIIKVGGSTEESLLEIRTFFTEEENNNLVVVNDLLGVFNVVDGEGDGTSLLLQPLDDFGSSSTTFVGNGSAVTLDEELEGGETSDFESGGEFLFNGTVDLGESDVGKGVDELSGSRSVFRGELLAVTTPGSVEFSQNEIIFSNGVIEILIGQDKDVFFSGVITSENSGDEEKSKECGFHKDLN